MMRMAGTSRWQQRLGLLMLALGLSLAAQADLPPDIGAKPENVTLPPVSKHWVWVNDMVFPHMTDSQGHLFDGDSGRFLGMISSGFSAHSVLSPDGHTLYFISTSSLITQPLHGADYPVDLIKFGFIPEFIGRLPVRVFCHELGVEVLAIGEGVTNVQVGDRCSVEPYMNCQRCYSCRRGLTNCCESNQTLGVMCDGGLCDRMILPARKLHVSRQLTYDQLALVETLAIGCHAVDRGGVRR